MQNLSDISVIRSVLEKHGFNFSKALGQNFLINPSVCPRMAEYSLADENTGVIEIGAGIGTGRPCVLHLCPARYGPARCC